MSELDTLDTLLDTQLDTLDTLFDTQLDTLLRLVLRLFHLSNFTSGCVGSFE